MTRLNRAAGLLLAATLVMQGCSSKPASKPTVTAKPAPSGVYRQSQNDGAPWWDKDVSGIPDAVPTPHYGPVKAAPYEVLGKKYYPIQSANNYRENGTASWYGTKFHGLKTANGEEYDLYGMTAAHKTLPLPSYVRVTNLDNGRTVVLRVNDRGPFYSDRIIDLSFAAAKKLGYAEKGVARVRVEGIDPVRWQAEQGKSSGQQPSPVEVYVPPASQHAGAVNPAELTSKPVSPRGLYLQAGAFANPDAAQLLSDKLERLASVQVEVSPVVRDQQILHRVRLGPLTGQQQADNLRVRIEQAGLGTVTVVNVD